MYLLFLRSLLSSFHINILRAEVAQLVERNLAKVEVAGSSLVFRSGKNSIFIFRGGIFYYKYSVLKQIYPGGGTGRRAGLKIQ